MVTTRSKRWNGKLDTLAADYLKAVMAQMEIYGDRVQFSLTTAGARPNYQVMNSAGKKIAFDSKHHLLHPEETDFAGSNATGVLTLEQLKSPAISATTSAPQPRAPRATAASIKAADLIDAAKYAYFKANRQTLPASIGEYASEITAKMRKGMSAEEAFTEVVKQHF